MYELKNGSARLVYALDGIKDDEAVLLKLANALNYVPEQLQQDITALNDFYEIARNKEAEKP